MKNNIFSFRAECFADVVNFFEALSHYSIGVQIKNLHTNGNNPDVFGEIALVADVPLTLDDLIELLDSKVTDGHVIARTLQQCQLAKNTKKS